MDMDEFNEVKLELLLSKLYREKKIYLVGDFNFDLLKVNQHDETSVFFNKMMSNFLLPLFQFLRK